MAEPDTTARALWVAGPRRIEVRDEPVAAPGSGDVIVRATYSGISRGTERLVFTGAVPESEYDRMRAPFQAGAFPFPVKYGYCSVGEVEAGPDDLVGRSVFCLHPHQTRYCVPRDAVTPIPGEVPPRRAVLAANLETALNGVWDARIAPGDRVAVIGAGVVGCLVGYLAARIVGCDVQLLDVDETKAEVARHLGLAFATPSLAKSDCDVVVHASGVPAGLQTALDLAGTEATVLELSWYGDRAVSVQLGGAFHPRRLRIVSSQVGTLPAWQRSRWTYRRRLDVVMSLLRDPVLDALLDGETEFECWPERAEAVLCGEAATLCHRLVYP